MRNMALRHLLTCAIVARAYLNNPAAVPQNVTLPKIGDENCHEETSENSGEQLAGSISGDVNCHPEPESEPQTAGTPRAL